MYNITSTWTELIQQFFPIFTTPGAKIFSSLMTGWILCTARRTITGILPFADPQNKHAHDAYHRFLPDARRNSSMARRKGLSSCWRRLLCYTGGKRHSRSYDCIPHEKRCRFVRFGTETIQSIGVFCGSVAYRRHLQEYKTVSWRPAATDIQRQRTRACSRSEFFSLFDNLALVSQAKSVQKIFLCPTVVLLEGESKLCRCVELPSQGALARKN
jgi:hypothetical protein